MIFSSAPNHKITISISIWASIFLLAAWVTQARAQQVIVYPKPESSIDTRSDYPLALLRLCEQKSNHKFVLKESNVNTQQGRSLRLLSQNQEIDIAWALTTPEREEKLLPIRIPIDRGLIGWRIALISSKNKAKFSRITTPAQLADLRAGQGHDWPDVEILKAAGFTLSTSASYEGMFSMLANGHVDYFPRAISEVWPEAESHRQLGLEVEPHWVIHYPAALYFFVNKTNTELAHTLEACLLDAMGDGSMQALFNNYFKEAIEKAQLSTRKIIHLENPLLPKATPLDKKEFWYSPLEKL